MFMVAIIFAGLSLFLIFTAAPAEVRSTAGASDPESRLLTRARLTTYPSFAVLDIARVFFVFGLIVLVIAAISSR